MAYATTSDVAVRLGRELEPTAEVPKVGALIEDISAFINVFCRRAFSVPVPGDVKAVVCSEVIGIMNTNLGIRSEQVGDVTVEYTPYVVSGLSDSAKEALEHYRPRVYSVQLQGNERVLTETIPWDFHSGIWP